MYKIFMFRPLFLATEGKRHKAKSITIAREICLLVNVAVILALVTYV